MLPPPYRLESERCVVRCYEPKDAPLLAEAIASSLENLRVWMPWATREPRSLAERIGYLRDTRARFDRDEDYTFGVFSSDEKRVLGGSGLHRRGGAAALEIGYWMRSDAQRQGYCTEVVAVLTRVALEVCGAEHVEIHCDPNNVASQGVPNKLGYRLDAVLRRRARTPAGEPRDTMIWSLFPEELAATPSAHCRYRGFNAAGDSI